MCSISGRRSVPSGLVGSGRVPGMIGGLVVGLPRSTGAPDGVDVAMVVDGAEPAEPATPLPGVEPLGPATPSVFEQAPRTSTPAPAAIPCNTRRRDTAFRMGHCLPRARPPSGRSPAAVILAGVTRSAI